MSLILEQLRKDFGGTIALNGVSCEFPERGVFACVGPNGSGKSTLLDILSGFIQRTSGYVRDASSGEIVGSRELRRWCVRLHQRVVLPMEITIDDFLRFVLAPELASCPSPRAGFRKFNSAGVTQRQAEVLTFLRSMGLDPALKARIGETSYGQQRALGLAAALLIPKPVVLLDEPLAGLASDAAKRAKHLILHASRDRLVILCEHDLSAVVELSERVIVLVGGSLLGDYPADRINMRDLLRLFESQSLTRSRAQQP